MQLVEVIPALVQAGMEDLFAVGAVFTLRPHVGRTPEYMERRSSLRNENGVPSPSCFPVAAVLIVNSHRAQVLGGEEDDPTEQNPELQRYSDVLYAVSSPVTHQRQCLFSGLGQIPPFYNTALGIACLRGRFRVMRRSCHRGGSLVEKKKVPARRELLPTPRPCFPSSS